MTKMTIRDILLLLRKRWYILVMITGLSTGLGFYWSFYKSVPIFSNTCTLLVNDRNQGRIQLSFNDILLYEKLMGTYKDIIRSKKILDAVAEQTEPPMSRSEIANALHVSTNASSQIISVSIEHPDYQMATYLVNLIAEEFSRQLPTIMNIDNVQILDRATADDHPYPIKPNKKRNMVISFIAGIIISVNWIFIRRFMDTRIRYEEDLLDILPYPMLGAIPNLNSKKRSY